MIRSVLFLCLIAPPLFAEPPHKDDVVRDDEQAVQGTWKVQKAIHGGEDMPAELRNNMTLEFKGNKATPHMNQQQEKPADFKLDATKSPRQIVIKTPDGQELHGIYELNGDTLKMCFSQGNKAPTKFESPKGSEIVLLVMEREKK